MTEYKLFEGCVIGNRIPFLEASSRKVLDKIIKLLISPPLILHLLILLRDMDFRQPVIDLLTEAALWRQAYVFRVEHVFKPQGSIIEISVH